MLRMLQNCYQTFRAITSSANKPTHCCAVLRWAVLCCAVLCCAVDKASEVACVAAIQSAFPDHLILGEEGGVIGSGESDYLW